MKTPRRIKSANELRTGEYYIKVVSTNEGMVFIFVEQLVENVRIRKAEFTETIAPLLLTRYSGRESFRDNYLRDFIGSYTVKVLNSHFVVSARYRFSNRTLAFFNNIKENNFEVLEAMNPGVSISLKEKDILKNRYLLEEAVRKANKNW